MDLRLTNYDVAIVNGDFEWVTGEEAIVQDITMRLRTWLGETPYDSTAGVPYLQVIFRRGTNADGVRAIVEQQIADTPGVTEVLELDVAVDGETRTAAITGRVRIDTGAIVPFDTGAIEP